MNRTTFMKLIWTQPLNKVKWNMYAVLAKIYFSNFFYEFKNLKQVIVWNIFKSHNIFDFEINLKIKD